VIQTSIEVDTFKQRLCDSLQKETVDTIVMNVAKGEYVYNIGDEGDTIYFISSGQIKLRILSPEGRECMLAIYSAGDIFGELGLSGLPSRYDQALAFEDAEIKKITNDNFFKRLSNDSLYAGFAQYLVARSAEQQQLIANLVTADSEYRLGLILLDLARKIGKEDRRSMNRKDDRRCRTGNYDRNRSRLQTQ
jgi:CRP/FNR family cyclic AMP-dependent transcriptional regulator